MEQEHKQLICFGEIHWATGLLDRLLGLLGNRHGVATLALVPCHDVHTVGMARSIDVAFVGADGSVLDAKRRIGPGKRLRVRGAAFVLEREANDEALWPIAGDVLVFGIGR